MDAIAAVAALAIPAALAYSAWRKAYVSLTFSVTIMVLFVATYLTSVPIGVTSRSPLWDLVLVHDGPSIPGEPLAVVTTMFMHYGTWHLLFNLLALIVIGVPLEERIGTLRWTVLFLLGGLFGTLLFLTLHWNETFFLLGASGAISSVLGAFGRLFPRERLSLFVPFLLPVGVPAIWVVIGFLTVSTFLVFLFPFGGIAHEAHIGGVAFGFAFAPLAMRIRGRPRAAASVTGLAELATTPYLQEALAHMEAAEEPEVRLAWLERFVDRMPCPRCQGRVVLRGNHLRSDCGWKHPVAGRKT